MAQLAVEKVVGDADQADDDVCRNGGVGVFYSFSKGAVLCLRNSVQLAKVLGVRVVLGPFGQAAGAQEVAVVCQKFFLAGPCHVGQLYFGFF